MKQNHQKIQELLTRGVENIYPSREFLESRLNSGKRLTIYTGYDPTAPTLHIGNGISLLKLRQFQELGHKIIMLIGDFTGMIGDPTDKTSVRQQLTKKQVLANCKNYKKQASAVLNFSGKNPAEIKYNSAWLGKLKFADVLNLASHFTVQRMLERDMFQARIKEEKPIYLHEFLYPLMQGYDSVAMGVDGEVGGNDQTFNMLAGRDLMKTLKNKEKFVLTVKLLADEGGKKMGKSEGNMVALSDSAEDMFGKVMSWSDGMILSGFELCTKIPKDEIEQMKKEMASGANPRDLKLKLAFEIVKTFLGEKSAKKGQEHFSSVIQNKEIPEKIFEKIVKSEELFEIVEEAGLAASRGEARRLIEQGGIKVGGKVIKDIYFKPDLGKDGVLIQKGKRFFVRVVR